MPRQNKNYPTMLSGLKTLIAFSCIAFQGFTLKNCENALRGVVNNFGDFYGRIVNLPISQSQIPQLNEVYSFYSTIPYRCNGKNNSSNAKIQGGE
jgi:hypothetical protein